MKPTKHAELMRTLEERQEESKKLYQKTYALMQEARKSCANYQEGDAAFDALKSAAESFLKDANATGSNS